MFKVFMICLLLIYYYYFYFDNSKPVPEPLTAMPKPPPHNYKFSSKKLNHFQFEANQHLAWEQELPNTYMYSDHKILPRDICYRIPDSTLIAAKGETLYEYIKTHPQTHNISNFQTNDDQMVQEGNVFYFKCKNNRIQKLDVCPSGKIFVRNQCQDINVCTGQVNKATFPHFNSNQFIECQYEKGTVKTCPKGTFFRQDRCVDMKSHAYFCQFNPHEHILLDGGRTRLDCEKGKPVFKTCMSPGLLFIDRDVCEPAICMNQRNGTKIGLPETTADLFKFIPGYIECESNKVKKIVQCDQTFYEEIDECFLPMVFNGSQCVLPQFGENVTSDDPDVILPVRNFSKTLKNWPLADKYDRMKGWYIDANGKRTLDSLPDGIRVSKRFKRESACDTDTDKVPVNSSIDRYYDCATHTTMLCPPDQFFNGIECTQKPLKSIDYEGLPIFQFDGLNRENWITAFDYSNQPTPQCSGDTQLSTIYRMCVHPDCMPYSFLRLVPDLGMLLPQEDICVYNESTKTLTKEEFKGIKYSYWNQKITNGPVAECVPGSKLETGNFIWDSTIYATCLPNQPFIFCPVPLGIELVKDGLYACKPPQTHIFTYSHMDTNTRTFFQPNELKQITISDPTVPITIQKRNRDVWHTLDINDPVLEILDTERINLKIQTNDAVLMQLRHRNTYPPNVAYEYDDQGQRSILTDVPTKGFLMKIKNFTTRAINFHRYNPISFVGDLDHHYLVEKP